MPEDFQPGQRWISESEPELGLGTIVRVNPRTVSVAFTASGEKREYSRTGAPLRRVQFRAGDTVRGVGNAPMTIESVVRKGGVLFYTGGGRTISEAELSDRMSFNKPEERLHAGQFDTRAAFDFRLAALGHEHRRRKSAVRGFAGGRIDLIPHQLYVASEVTRRLAPRVLLADEVGLGKTIEACLIVHRLILTGRAQRVLILVPDSLVHQWFLELLRRFNLWFHIFDEERCESIERLSPGANPFADDQLVLCSVGWCASHPDRARQAAEGEWDMLVVDEAHHLGWSPQDASPEYRLVEAAGSRTPGLLLLTATPEQLGVPSHFARLRLLDPDRFYDLAAYVQESEQYEEVAALSDRLLDNRLDPDGDAPVISRILAEPEDVVRGRLQNVREGDGEAREDLLDALVDRHGTGRVRFRNTRATIKGFPRRIVSLEMLAADRGDFDQFEALAEEFAAEAAPEDLPEQPDLTADVRIEHLARLLRSLGREKVLLICRNPARAIAIDAAMRQRMQLLKIGVFHEELSLVQRDRNAAWFADPHGAQLLVCSEIGSEGRNFQFAHHLVLFDLPLNPELLEQRIGRLDRIGQTSDIHVHVPFVAGSPQEVVARWYEEGLDSFTHNLQGGRELLEQFGDRVFTLARTFHDDGDAAAAALQRLIEESRLASRRIAEKLQHGRDRLLEIHSFRPAVSGTLVEAIRGQDADRSLDDFTIAMLENYGVPVEEIALRTYRVGSAGVLADSFPGLPSDGFTATCDRKRALAHEDVQFLTWDHPLVTGALDLLLGSEKGNCAFAHWIDGETAGLYLQAVYVLECVAPPRLHADRFLPPTPLSVTVDHTGSDVSTTIRLDEQGLEPSDDGAAELLESSRLRRELIPLLLKNAEALAVEQAGTVIAAARERMSSDLQHEVLRLRDLQKVNRTVRNEEIELIENELRELDRHLEQARVRLDALCLVRRGP